MGRRIALSYGFTNENSNRMLCVWYFYRLLYRIDIVEFSDFPDYNFQSIVDFVIYLFFFNSSVLRQWFPTGGTQEDLASKKVFTWKTNK